MSRRGRFFGIVGVALRQLRQDRARTLFAVFGVAFAVLSVTLFVGVGVGVQSTGEELLDRSQGDLWVSGGPIEVRPSSVGGFQNPIVDAHNLSQDLAARPDTKIVEPMSFQVVYVSATGEDFETTLGTGLTGKPVTDKGSGFRSAPTHYAGGSYRGNMTHEVIVSPQTADKYDLEINDTLHVGGTINNAKRNEFEVVGISSTFSSLLGTSSVTLRLAELQTLTGTAYDDRATIISIEVADDTDPTAVKESIEADYPELTVRTNREQFLSVLERQSVVIVGGISLVLLAVFSGIVFSVNVFLSLMYAQQTDFAIYRAVGGSGWSVLALALIEAGLVATAGAVLGLVATPLVAVGLDAVASSVTGFGSIVQVPLLGYLLGGSVAVVFGLVGSILGVRHFTRSDITRTLGQ